MAKAADAHAALLSFCKGQPGIAIGKELIEYLIKNAIVQANSVGQSGQLIQFPSNNAWYTFPIAFTMELDAKNVAVTLHPLLGPAGINPVPRLVVTGLSATFAIYNRQTLFSTHVVRYKSITAAFQISTKKLSLVKQEIQGDWDPNPTGDANELWRTMTKLPDGTAFSPKLQAEWQVQERAYMVLAQDAIGTSFIESVMLPNILGMIQAFTFTGAIDLSGTTDLVMITGLAEWNIGCSRRPSAPELVGTPSAPAVKQKVGVMGTTTFKLSDGNGEGGYPPMPNPEHSEFGDVFVHLPKVFMEHRFDGIAKPSVTFSDDGSVAIIHWHYEASIAPAPGSTLQISLQSLWPTEFKVSLPLQTFGSAGAGVKIACIDYDVVGVRYRGNIDPFEAYFKIGLDANAADLYFESRIGSVKAVGFQFDSFPRLEFPITEIADFILGQVASTVITSQAGRILNVTRFSLANVGLFKGFGQMRNLLAAVPDQVATTYGISFTKT